MNPQLMYPDQAPPALMATVQSILQATSFDTIPAAPKVFVRIARLDRILIDGKLRAGMRLAGQPGDPPKPPVVFLTIPEEIAGFTADAVLKRIGYTANDIATLFGGGQAAAIVFRYPEDVQSLADLDGSSHSDVQKRVLRATWKNTFGTFKDLAEVDRSPLQLEADDRQLVASFPFSGQSRLMGTPYSQIQAQGGEDWHYRWLLQTLLWVTPEFLGSGFAADGDGGPGASEYLGPNMSLSKFEDAQSLAIVSLN